MWSALASFGPLNTSWAAQARFGRSRLTWFYPVMDGMGLVPSGYQFGSAQYKPEDLLIFKHLSMKNPYGLGMSPTQAAIEYARLEDTLRINSR